MYGQKAQFGLVSAGITAASWWMWSVTIALALAAVVLCYRAVTTLRSSNSKHRP
jgi:hypothetical protein